MKNRVVIIAAVGASLCIARADGQDLAVAPQFRLMDIADRLWLPVSQSKHAVTVEVSMSAVGDTNVTALGPASRRHAAPHRFSADRAIFYSDRDSRLLISWDRWRFSLSAGASEFYTGNRDAGQLYLDSVSGSLDLTRPTSPQATMNRSDTVRARISRVFQIGRASSNPSLEIGLSYLGVRTARVGELTGHTTGNQFDGTLAILASAGPPSPPTESHGMSIDAAVTLSLSRRARCVAAVDNMLGRVWHRRWQTIDADVATNTVVPDSEGFLHEAPLLRGTIGERDAEQRIRRRLDVALAYESGSVDWLGSVRHDYYWRAAIGASHRAGPYRLWCLVWPSPNEWQAGVSHKNVSLVFGSSAIRIDDAKRLTASLAFRTTLGR